MSYGLNVEMHRQSELAKRYLAICHQLIPCLSQEVLAPLIPNFANCFSFALATESSSSNT